MIFSETTLEFALYFGVRKLHVPAEGVKWEKADYAEIEEIKQQLRKERELQREQDFYAEISARDIYAG